MKQVCKLCGNKINNENYFECPSEGKGVTCMLICKECANKAITEVACAVHTLLMNMHFMAEQIDFDIVDNKIEIDINEKKKIEYVRAKTIPAFFGTVDGYICLMIGASEIQTEDRIFMREVIKANVEFVFGPGYFDVIKNDAYWFGCKLPDGLHIYELLRFEAENIRMKVEFKEEVTKYLTGETLTSDKCYDSETIDALKKFASFVNIFS